MTGSSATRLGGSRNNSQTQVLALEIEEPGAAEADFQQHLRGEAARVWELYQAGPLREVFVRLDRPAVVLRLECADVEAARPALRPLSLLAGRADRL